MVSLPIPEKHARCTEIRYADLRLAGGGSFLTLLTDLGYPGFDEPGLARARRPGEPRCEALEEPKGWRQETSSSSGGYLVTPSAIAPAAFASRGPTASASTRSSATSRSPMS